MKIELDFEDGQKVYHFQIIFDPLFLIIKKERKCPEDVLTYVEQVAKGVYQELLFKTPKVVVMDK